MGQILKTNNKTNKTNNSRSTDSTILFLGISLLFSHCILLTFSVVSYQPNYFPHLRIHIFIRHISSHLLQSFYNFIIFITYNFIRGKTAIWDLSNLSSVFKTVHNIFLKTKMMDCRKKLQQDLRSVKKKWFKKFKI